MTKQPTKTGKCIICNKETAGRNLFQDDPNDRPYYDWCCDGCYAELTNETDILNIEGKKQGLGGRFYPLDGN